MNYEKQGAIGKIFPDGHSELFVKLPEGSIGNGMSIQYTRALLNSAMEGKLNDVEFETDPVFGLYIPKSCPGVPAEILNPRNTWKDKVGYDEKAKELAGTFKDNFKQYKDFVSPEVDQAGPLV